MTAYWCSTIQPGRMWPDIRAMSFALQFFFVLSLFFFQILLLTRFQQRWWDFWWWRDRRPLIPRTRHLSPKMCGFFFYFAQASSEPYHIWWIWAFPLWLEHRPTWLRKWGLESGPENVLMFSLFARGLSRRTEAETHPSLVVCSAPRMEPLARCGAIWVTSSGPSRDVLHTSPVCREIHIPHQKSIFFFFFRLLIKAVHLRDGVMEIQDWVG